MLAHPSLAMIFLSNVVIGPGIFRGIEALLGALGRAGMDPAAAVHAVYAVLIYTAGFVAWEVPRTRLQPVSAYGAAWRREFAGLEEDDFPLTTTVLDELARLAGDEQFELRGSALLTDVLECGLTLLSIPADHHDTRARARQSERGLFADFRRTEVEAARLVHGGPDHFIARVLLDGDGLSGNHALVYR